MILAPKSWFLWSEKEDPNSKQCSQRYRKVATRTSGWSLQFTRVPSHTKTRSGLGYPCRYSLCILTVPARPRVWFSWFRSDLVRPRHLSFRRLIGHSIRARISQGLKGHSGSLCLKTTNSNLSQESAETCILCWWQSLVKSILEIDPKLNYWIQILSKFLIFTQFYTLNPVEESHASVACRFQSSKQDSVEI